MVMVTKKPKPPMAKRDDTAAKIDASIVRDAKIVAAYRDITLAEYLSELLRPLVARDLKAEQERRMRSDESPPLKR
jgi:hypothetical protein